MDKKIRQVELVEFFGGDEGGRTPYLLNAIQALYQLSYTPKARCILYHLSSVVNRLVKKQREYYSGQNKTHSNEWVF